MIRFAVGPPYVTPNAFFITHPDTELLEEPGGPGPAEYYTNLHKNIENKI